jgi:hypothetical protein
MAISLQADSTLPQGYILVDGQRAATIVQPVYQLQFGAQMQ